MFWLFLFLIQVVFGDNYWVIKQERTQTKTNFRIQLELPNKKFVVFSKHKPNKHAVPFGKAHSPGVLNIVSKECSSLENNFIDSQTVKGPTNCLVLDAYNTTEHPYQLFQEIVDPSLDLKGDIVSIVEKWLLVPQTSFADNEDDVKTMIVDTGLKLNHCFFTDSSSDPHFYTYLNTPLTQATDSDHSKVSAYIKTSQSDFDDQLGGHGTHVAGIFGGRRCFTKQGVSTGKIVFVDVFMAGSLGLAIPSNMIGLLGTLGVQISSHSWGGFSRGQYDELTWQFDSFVYKHNQKHVPVVAAGNNCPAGYISTPCFGWNVVCIGASNSNGVIQSFSCRSLGKKMYPLVYLPGVSIVSAYAEANDLFQFKFAAMTGTSMATPMAAGIVYLLIQRLHTLKIKPSNSLVRALLLANTYDKNRVFRVQNNFFTDKNKWDVVDHMQVPIQTNYKKCYYLEKGVAFTAALSWIEPPSNTLTNDLDLMLKFNDHSIWGNYGSESDTVNNNEIVLTKVKESTTVTVMVSDTTASQAYFSLAITSSSDLLEVECNATCSDLDPPIECDFDQEGNSGYYLCSSDGKLDRTKCLFHACDVSDKSVFVNGSCLVLNNTVSEPILVKNTYYVNLIMVKGCKEHCFISGQETCECSLITTSQPEEKVFIRQVPSSSSLISSWGVQVIQLGLLLVLK